MEWVETTGRSVEEAKEAALDELGVDEAEAEFEVVAEAQTGLFGRLRSEARVRARVMPTAPRSKEDRRDRRRRNPRAASTEGGETTTAAGEASRPAKTSRPKQDRASAPASASDEAPSDSSGPAPDASAAERGTSSSRRARSSGRNGVADRHSDPVQTKGAEVEVALDQQAAIAAQFLTDLTAEFGLSAKVDVSSPDEETAEIQLSGSDLGLLIGPKGATLVAIQNLARTVVFHETGATNGHINVDVGGYRHKRTEALIRFAHQVAAKVQETGARTPLEPMSAVDRKIVHDTIGGIEGVATASEGEEPNRRVVVMPASSAG